MSSPDSMTSPYRGLTPYTEDDAAYFFGRTSEIANIKANLEVARLTLLYGPSGVGKTSVLRAGVIHQLEQRARANQVDSGRPELIPVYFNRWQGESLLGLTQQIFVTTFQLYQGVPNAPDLLAQPIPPFLELLTKLGAQTESDLLLVLDQFEEYFLYHPDEQPPNSFTHAFVQAINTPELRVNFLISLREDALARIDHFKGQIPFLLDNRLSIGHLDRTAGNEAVIKPLERFNQEQGTTYTIEPALVETVLDQVGSGQVALSKQGVGEQTSRGVGETIEAPYLQLVLTRLWEQERINGSNHLCRATLEGLGGAQTIARNYLDNTLDALPTEERALAARFFDHLVTPSGTKIALKIDELAYYADADKQAVERVVQGLQDRRLLRGVQASTSVTQYEIFHDVLGRALLDWQVRYKKAQAEQRWLETQKAARSDAEFQMRRAQANELGLTVMFLLEDSRDPTLSLPLILAIYAVNKTLSVDGYVVSSADRALQQAITSSRRKSGMILQRCRHTASVLTSSYSPDDRYIVSAGADQALHIWNIATGKKVNVFQDDTAWILSVAYSPDGRYIASASQDQIRIWDFTRYQEIKHLRGHQNEINSVIYSPDGQHIISASADKTVRIWDAATGREVRQLTGHTNSVLSAAYSPDGQYIVSASTDQTVRIWNAATGREVRQLTGHTDGISWVVYSPDGQYIASAGDDQVVHIWDAATGKKVHHLIGHTDRVLSVAYSPNGQHIVSTGADQMIRIWNAITGREVNRLQGHTASVWLATYSSDGQYIASVSEDSTMCIWDAINEKEVSQFTGHKRRVSSAIYSPDGQHIVSASDDQTVRIWNVTTGKEANIFKDHAAGIWSAAYSPDGQNIVSTDANGIVYIWDVAIGKMVRQLTHKSASIYRVAYSPNGEHIIGAGADTNVRIWDVATGKEVRQLTGHKSTVQWVSYSPDGQHIVSASSDKTVRIWDAATGSEICQFSSNQSQVSSADYSPDGKYIVSAHTDHIVRIWDVATNKEVRRFTGHTAGVFSAIYSPNGQHIVSAGADRIVRIWDVATGKEVRQIIGHMAWILSAVYSPDGRHIVSADAEGNIRIWVASIEELLEQAQVFIQRNPPILTPEELQQFGLKQVSSQSRGEKLSFW